MYVLGETDTLKGNYKKGLKLYYNADEKNSIKIYKQSLAYLTRVIELEPNNTSALFWKGRAEYQIAKLTQQDEEKKIYAQAGIQSYQSCLTKPKCKKHEKTIKRNMYYLKKFTR